jgi:hypothetical protein
MHPVVCLPFILFSTTAKEPRMIYKTLAGIAMGAIFFHLLITITEVLHRSSGLLLLLRCLWQKELS